MIAELSLIWKEGENIRHGIITSAAQGEQLRPQEPQKVCGIGVLSLLIAAVQEQLLQRGQIQGMQAGYCRQDLSCAADPAEVKKVSSSLSHTQERSCRVIRPFWVRRVWGLFSVRTASTA